MVNCTGKFQHVKNENLDEYFKAVGVPYIPRKIMASSNPSLEITTNENGEWSVIITTLFRTITLNFKLDEAYDEAMPGGVTLKNTTVKDGDKLVTTSLTPDGIKTFRTYEFTDNDCIITYKHEPSGVEGKRYFKRI